MKQHDLTPHYVDPNSLTMFAGNPNHGDEDSIEDSLSENGFYETIAVQKSTGQIISGNHRVKVARKLGLETVPVVYLDVNDEEAKRIVIASNATARKGVTDDMAQARLISEIQAKEGNAIRGLGLDEDEIADFMVMVEHQEAEAARFAASAEHIADVAEANPFAWSGATPDTPGQRPTATKGAPTPGKEEPEYDYGNTGSNVRDRYTNPERVNNSRRLMVLDLPLAVYAWLADRLEELGEQWDLDTNTEIVLAAVAEATGTDAPELTGADKRPTDVQTEGAPVVTQ